MNSEVSRVEVNSDGKTINLVLTLHGFEHGAPVEISGQATQANGAVASFYSVQQMPDTHDVPVGSVTVVPGNPPFDPGIPVTVVARAAQAWISTLNTDNNANALVSRVLTDSPTRVAAAWQRNSAQWAVAWAGQKDPAVW